MHGDYLPFRMEVRATQPFQLLVTPKNGPEGTAHQWSTGDGVPVFSSDCDTGPSARENTKQTTTASEGGAPASAEEPVPPLAPSSSGGLLNPLTASWTRFQ